MKKTHIKTIHIYRTTFKNISLFCKPSKFSLSKQEHAEKLMYTENALTCIADKYILSISNLSPVNDIKLPFQQ